MFNGITQITGICFAVTRNCKTGVKISYAVTSVLCRNLSTVTQATNDRKSVPDFYSGRSVFVTGGTGFLGKHLIEKLLFSCKDVDKVYILIRDKKGETTQQRLQQMFKNSVFERVKKTCPQNFKKIVPIIGDISLPNLGIKPEDEQTLIDKVSVVFHSAATVKFFEPMQVAMNLNYEGTRRTINLSRRMKSLHSFVYISTAFTQSIYPVLEERVYPAPASPEEVYNFIKKYNDDMKKTQEFIGNRPSTYAFSKAMSENYVGTCLDLPVTIVRPSIVCSTAKEPMPGWLENWNGMTGLAFDLSRGLNFYCFGKPEQRCDLIPVDFVTNLSLIAAAKYRRGDKVPVYNSTTSGSNPVTYSTFMGKFIAENQKYGFYEGNPHVVFYNTKWMYDLATKLFLTIPAHTKDFFLRLKGAAPRHVDQLKRVITTRHSVEYFVKHDWTMKADATRALYASLSKASVEIAVRRCVIFVWHDGSGDVSCARSTRSGDERCKQRAVSGVTRPRNKAKKHLFSHSTPHTSPFWWSPPS